MCPGRFISTEHSLPMTPRGRIDKLQSLSKLFLPSENGFTLIGKKEKKMLLLDANSFLYVPTFTNKN